MCRYPDKKVIISAFPISCSLPRFLYVLLLSISSSDNPITISVREHSCISIMFANRLYLSNGIPHGELLTLTPSSAGVGSIIYVLLALDYT